VNTLDDFTDTLRGSKGVESRSAILGYERKDIFRGKDFARWYRQHAEALVDLPITKGTVDVGGVRRCRTVDAARNE